MRDSWTLEYGEGLELAKGRCALKYIKKENIRHWSCLKKSDAQA